MKTQRLAAIDIGSNSLKLAIVEAAASDSFTVITQDRERVRLGHETLRNKFLSDEAIQLSVDAISRFKSIAETRETDEIIAVATASVREAKNAAQFVETIEEKTGVHIEIIAALEEARLIGIATSQYYGKEDGSLLNIDIGGGSTEVSLMNNDEPRKLFSMKLGAVGLTEKFLTADPPTEDEIKQIKREIQFALVQPSRKIKGEEWEMVSGTSGTIRAVASILNLINENELLASPTIKLKSLINLNKRLLNLDLEQRTNISVINERRAEVIIAGGLILEGVMKTLEIDSIEACSYALREGVIIDYLRKSETENLPPVPDVEDIKLRDVFAVGRRFGYEENHALQVATMGEKLFDRLAPVYNLKRNNRTFLSAAALLHDIGYHISHESHHKHSLYLIKHSKMTGFNEAEKAIIANIARYHRKALPSESHAEYMALNENDQEIVNRMSSILRLADGLDRGYEGRVEDILIERESNKLNLTLVSKEDCSSEIYAINMKKESFEFFYECELVVKQTFSEDKAKEMVTLS